MTNDFSLESKKLKTLLVYYLSLIIVFAGIFTILYLYLNSFISIWNMPEWGIYIVLNLVISVIISVTIITSLVINKEVRHLLIVLTSILVLIDIYKIVFQIKNSIDIKSVVTLALLVFILHTYLLLMNIKYYTNKNWFVTYINIW